MSKAVAKFNGLNGAEVTPSALKKLLDVATAEGQTFLARRIRTAFAAADKKNEVFVIDGPATEQVPADILQGLSGVPEYLIDQEDTGLNKAVSPTDIYKMVSDKIIAALEADHKWTKSWGDSQTGYITAYNFITKKPYRSVNQLVLGSLYMFDPVNYPPLENPYYLTFNQITTLGGKIIKRAKAKQATYYNFVYKIFNVKTGLDYSTSDEKKAASFVVSNYRKIPEFKGNKPSKQQVASYLFQNKIAFLKYYNVFNGKDITGIDFDLDNFNLTGKLKPIDSTKHKKVDTAEAIVAHFPAPKVTIKHGGSRAYYRPSADLVQMPEMEQFKTVQGYYTTLFHELIHATGSKKPMRLAREGGVKFGDERYSFEELVAEMGAAFVMAEAGMLNHTLRNTAAYLKGWRKNLIIEFKKDPKIIFKAATLAQKATDFFLNRDKDGIPAYIKKSQDPTTKKVGAISQPKKKTPARTPKKKVTVPKPKKVVAGSTFKNGDQVTVKKKWGKIVPGDIGKISERKTRKASNGDIMHRVMFGKSARVLPASILTSEILKVDKVDSKGQYALLGAKNKRQPKKKSITFPKKKTAAKPKGLKGPTEETILTPKTTEAATTAGAIVPLPSSGSSGRLKRASDIANMHFDTLQFTEGWQHMFQTPAKNIKIAFMGKPKNGKSSGACELAAYLTRFGNVLYNFADQGVSSSTQKILGYTGLAEKQNAFITDATTLQDLHQDIADSKADFVFIDMINDYIDLTGITATEFKRDFVKRYPEKSFVLIFEATKAGDFKGDQKWTHVVDQLVSVEDYILTTRGRYGAGDKIIWLEEARKLNPSKVDAILEEQNNTDTGEVLPDAPAEINTDPAPLKYNFETS